MNLMNGFSIVASVFNLMEPGAVVAFLLFVAVGGAFLLWMVVDCALNESPENNLKLVWLLIILFAPLIYFFVRKLSRRSAQVLPQPAPQVRQHDCPHCGASLEPNAVVCPTCGRGFRFHWLREFTPK